MGLKIFTYINFDRVTNINESIKNKFSDPKGSLKFYFPEFLELYDRPIDHPTSDGHLEKLHFNTFSFFPLLDLYFVWREDTSTDYFVRRYVCMFTACWIWHFVCAFVRSRERLSILGELVSILSNFWFIKDPFAFWIACNLYNFDTDCRARKTKCQM